MFVLAVFANLIVVAGLVVAGAAYVLDAPSAARHDRLRVHRGRAAACLAVPSVLGEGWFAGWLLLRAGRRASDLDGRDAAAS